MGVDFKEGENMGTLHLELGSESVFRGFDFESFGSSSSSDLSTLVGSELDSTEVESTDEEEDDEFMAELSRQMADYMLKDDDENEDEHEDNKDYKEEKNIVAADFDSENVKEDDGEGTNSVKSSSVKESNTVGYPSTPAAFPGDQLQPIQFYQLGNQPRVPLPNGCAGILGRGGGGGKNSDESTQNNNKQQQICKNMGRLGPPPNVGGGLTNYGGKGYPYVGSAGSGMRAVFLGGLGSRNASSGTGVFLPRTTITPTTPDHQHRSKKSGCSTVLIPTRVLQALEQHFSNIESSSSSPSNRHSPQPGRRDSTQGKGQGQGQAQPSRAAMDHQLPQLPQEWTY